MVTARSKPEAVRNALGNPLPPELLEKLVTAWQSKAERFLSLVKWAPSRRIWGPGPPQTENKNRPFSDRYIAVTRAAGEILKPGGPK